MTKKELLSIKKWYHATTAYAAQKIQEKGIRADVNLNLPRDFESGFYLNADLRWSHNYIYNILCNKNVEDAKDYVVMEFSYDIKKVMREYGEESLIFFKKQSEEYAEFVFQNRINFATFQYLSHLAAGPMASDEQIFMLKLYEEKIINKPKVIALLQGQENETQLLLHSQEICDMIDVKKDILNIYSWNPREVNINEKHS